MPITTGPRPAQPTAARATSGSVNTNARAMIHRLEPAIRVTPRGVGLVTNNLLFRPDTPRVLHLPKEG